jgi:transposase-like protein
MSKSTRKRRNPAQIIRTLAEGESMLAAGNPSAKVYQKLGIAESTWMRWKQQYGGMNSEEAQRLGKLEVENRRLKELLAEAELDKRILKVAAEGNF